MTFWDFADNHPELTGFVTLLIFIIIIAIIITTAFTAVCLYEQYEQNTNKKDKK